MSSINCIWYVATSHGLTEMAVVVTGVRNALLFCQGKLCIKNVAKIVLDGRRKLRREISCLVILALDYMLLGKIFFHRKKMESAKDVFGNTGRTTFISNREWKGKPG